MKVYVITSGIYSDYHIDAVALDGEEARIKCAALNNSKHYDPHRIEEYDTEDMKVSANEDINIVFSMNVDKNTGAVINITKGNITTEHIGMDINYNENYGRTIGCRAVLPDGTTKEKAKKIMLDRIAEFKAEQAGV